MAGLIIPFLLVGFPVVAVVAIACVGQQEGGTKEDITTLWELFRLTVAPCLERLSEARLSLWRRMANGMNKL